MGLGRHRLTKSADFNRVYREGRSWSSEHLVVYAIERGSTGREEGRRLGVSVGRKVGGSVERTKIKRVLREAFWNLEMEVPGGCDVVLVARPSMWGLVERGGQKAAQRVLKEVVGRMELGG